MLYVLLVEYQTSLVAQMIKNPPERQETQIQSLGWENPLEKRKATHSSILAWEILWTETGRLYSPWHCKESNTTKRLAHILTQSQGVTTKNKLHFKTEDIQ